MMTVKKGQILEADIEKPTFGGAGLTRVDGLAVFVKKAVPGDRVRIQISRRKKSYAEARLLDLIAPSPFRTTPPCPYCDSCGGCPWQMLDYERQLEFKRALVAESLEHIGLVKDIPVHPVLESTSRFAYRNKMEFSFSDRRWLLPGELARPDVPKDFALGLHVPGTFSKVLQIEACLLQPEVGNQILKTVQERTRASGVPPYGLKSHTGYWRFLMLRRSAFHGTWMVNLITADGREPCLEALAKELTATYPQVVSVVHNINTRKAAIAVGEREAPLAGDRCIIDRIGDFEFEISANSFFQTNTAGAQRLYETVKGYAALTGSEQVLDLYSGTGTIPIFLSHAARQIVGIEILENAVRDARKNCERNGIENCHFLCGDIKSSLARISWRPDVAIIDPPRTGMHPDVVRQVQALAPQRIVYVSCNPASLARDLGLLKDHYRVREIQPVDMFPHTYHIECVAALERVV